MSTYLALNLFERVAPLADDKTDARVGYPHNSLVERVFEKARFSFAERTPGRALVIIKLV
jgi:hypothetical protein